MKEYMVQVEELYNYLQMFPGYGATRWWATRSLQVWSINIMAEAVSGPELGPYRAL
jgi:hypothetical protein